MSAALAILARIWPYVLCAMVAGYLTHRVIDVPRYDALQTSLASYKAQEADKDAAAQKAATDALQAQIATRLATEANNGKVIAQLQDERDAAIAARNFSDRLLAAAAKTGAPTCSQVPATGHQPAPDAAGQSPSSGQLAQLLRSAALETAQCFERYSALQLQLQPQLRSP
jgi:hypothetical protein